ncbi:hotdog family protein [Xanthomonadaceae bacterium XH05]|nr:hotdog family protein [Xanthomonadaceae bacterium XH05]
MRWPIDALIPHRGPMRLIDHLIDWDAQSIRVGLHVPDEGLFHDARGVPSYVGIEYMAQAVAAWAGCQARARGAAPPLGFLLGTRRYECTLDHFLVGMDLVVDARCELMGENGLGAFACQISRNDEVLANALISVFEPPDAAAFLENTS